MKTRSVSLKKCSRSTSVENPNEFSTNKKLGKCSPLRTNSISRRENPTEQNYDKKLRSSMSSEISVNKINKNANSCKTLKSKLERQRTNSTKIKTRKNTALIGKAEPQNEPKTTEDIIVLNKPKSFSRKASLSVSSIGDPFELKVDENLPLKIPNKRKFFSSQGAGRAKQLNCLNFDVLRKKLGGYSKGPLSSQQTNVPRKPLSDEERIRIATTTIWLPVPSVLAFRQQVSENKALSSTPVSTNTACRPTIEVENILNSKPIVRIQQFNPLPPASPILPPAAAFENVSPVFDHQQPSESFLTSRPSLIYANVPQSLPESFSAPAATSFAEPIPHDKLHLQTLHSSSYESSFPSKSGSRTSSTKQHSEKDDNSNYADWLEAFSAQLEPYESFNLSTD